jgi:hypothetical protein
MAGAGSGWDWRSAKRSGLGWLGRSRSLRSPVGWAGRRRRSAGRWRPLAVVRPTGPPPQSVRRPAAVPTEGAQAPQLPGAGRPGERGPRAAVIAGPDRYQTAPGVSRRRGGAGEPRDHLLLAVLPGPGRSAQGADLGPALGRGPASASVAGRGSQAPQRRGRHRGHWECQLQLAPP